MLFTEERWNWRWTCDDVGKFPREYLPSLCCGARPSCRLVDPFDAHCCHMRTAIKHPVPDRVKPSFVIFDIWALWRSALRQSGHSDAQGWASECPDVKNYKRRLNPVWHRMLIAYSNSGPQRVSHDIKSALQWMRNGNSCFCLCICSSASDIVKNCGWILVKQGMYAPLVLWSVNVDWNLELNVYTRCIVTMDSCVEIFSFCLMSGGLVARNSLVIELTVLFKLSWWMFLVSTDYTGRAKKSNPLGKILHLWNCSRYIYQMCRDYRWGFSLHILQILLK